MKYIYYPEYELEYSHLLPKKSPLDHILNLRLLMFLCDHVILPPSHLLYTSGANITALTHHLQEFFNAGKIVTTAYESGIDNYFESRLLQIQDPVTRVLKKAQAKNIRDNLLSNHDVEHNQSKEGQQLALFYDRVLDLVENSPIHKKGTVLLLDRMKAAADRTGEPLHSRQFKEVLGKLSQDQEITSKQTQHFLNLMSSAYYYSGTDTMNTLVSYNSYFKKINLQNKLRETHSEDAANLIIDPIFLKRLFEVIGIRMEDVHKLRLADYREIMSQPYWTSFMVLFESLYTSAEELETLLSCKESALEIYKKKKDRVSTLLGIANDFVLGLLLLPASPAAGLGVPVVLELLKAFFPPVIQLDALVKRNTTDKMIDSIARSKEPLLEFSYRLNAVVQTLTEGA